MLDRAYLQWTPVLSQEANTALLAGKIKQPFYVIKDLVWDSDLNPEGFAFRGAMGPLFFNAAYYLAEERKADDETTMTGAQIGAQFDLQEAKVVVGLTYYGWNAMQGYSALFEPTDTFGNSAVPAAAEGEEDDGVLNYAEDFGLIEGFVKVGFDMGAPISLYGDYVVNHQADSGQDTAYMFGLTVGKAKEKGSFQVDYNYRFVEADAVIGAYTDSDSFGGGTNGKGGKLQVKYQMDKNWQAAASIFINELGLAPEDVSLDYKRLQLDLIAKF